jgi:NhaP-type Na+/H+ or K+/H+ antiporter
MNIFDAAIYLGLIVAVVTGFNAGFLRSLVTILAYLVAMPIAVWVMSFGFPWGPGQPRLTLGAEFAAVVRNLSGGRHPARKTDADGAGRSDRV